VRTKAREWDVPTGVCDPLTMAAAVMADYRRSHRGGRGPMAGDVRLALLGPVETQHRERLLERARAGEAAAIQRLQREYRLRLLSPAQAQNGSGSRPRSPRAARPSPVTPTGRRR